MAGIALQQQGRSVAVRSAGSNGRRCCRTTAPRSFRGQLPAFRRHAGRGGWGQWAPQKAAAEQAMGGAGEVPEPSESKKEEAEEQQFKVFPRIKERDPYRKLGLKRDADFEEIQAARNFLVEQYRWHEASRESIEMSFEKILNEKMSVRHKRGFRPPTTGRKSDAEGDPEPETLAGKIKDAMEPDIPVTTIVNEGVIYLALAIWAAIQSVAADPILPMGLAFGIAAYKIFHKRNKRNPDGPYFGNSPLFGALGYSLIGMFSGVLLGLLSVSFLPFPSFIQPQSFAVGLIPFMCGVMAICFK